MPYDARVFQILIASPGDVQEERKIIADVIYEWNQVNSRDRRVVILPLRWETHSSPEMGARAQAVINKQVVNHCDMAVGVFWTRVGTPTSEAESGTAEEVARVGDAGKPVMLYFSKSKVDLESIDLEEYKRLREFKAKVYPQGLMESYSSLVDFREKFAHQLALKMLDIVAADSVEQSKGSVSRRLVALSFAHGDPPQILPSPTVLQFDKIICSNFNDIPDFLGDPEDSTAKSDAPLRIGISRGSPNPDYYRQAVDYYCRRPLYKPLRLAVTGLADHGVRDLYMELRVSGLHGDLALSRDPRIDAPPQPYSDKVSSNKIPSDKVFGDKISAHVSGTLHIGDRYYITTASSGKLSLEAIAAEEWRMELEIPVVQARRTVFSVNEFWLAVDHDCTVVFDATVYSSDSTPFSLQAKIDVRITSRKVSYSEIIEQFHEARGGNLK